MLKQQKINRQRNFQIKFHEKSVSKNGRSETGGVATSLDKEKECTKLKNVALFSLEMCKLRRPNSLKYFWQLDMSKIQINIF